MSYRTPMAHVHIRQDVEFKAKIISRIFNKTDEKHKELNDIDITIFKYLQRWK